MKVLVAGGAGYIGSQVALDLNRRGHQTVVFDNLAKGHRDAVLKGKFIQGDISDTAHVEQVLKEEKIDAVIHLAAHSLVGESVSSPGKYFRNNIYGGHALLDAMIACNVKVIVFSSTAAVYGEPEKIPIPEEHPKNPGNPYGLSKLTFEGIMKSYDTAYGLRFIALRYFNAAGADLEEEIGEDHRPETHLIPIVLQTALGLRERLDLYGADYPTDDGTCIRDYIHVADLSKAHLLALEALANGGSSNIYNLGNGLGYSNRQLVEIARKITGAEIPVKEGPRRPGDPAVLVASSERIQRDLNWKPEYPKLETIIESAWHWHKKHPQGYDTK